MSKCPDCLGGMRRGHLVHVSGGMTAVADAFTYAMTHGYSTY